MDKKPDFIIAGAGRSGTTTLFHLLKQHPDICMPRKELSFFRDWYDQGIDAYLQFFQACPPGTVIGDGSQNEMIGPRSPQRMQALRPDLKLIFILRDPVDRMYSDYKRRVQKRGLSRDFLTLIREEPRLIEKSLYHKHLSRYLAFFPWEQIQVLFFEAFAANSDPVLRKCCAFLGVDPDFQRVVPPSGTNASGMPWSRELQRWLHRCTEQDRPVYRRSLEPALKRTFLDALGKYGGRLNQLGGGRRFPPLPARTRTRLLDTYFREDILALEALLGTDLSSWKQ